MVPFTPILTREFDLKPYHHRSPTPWLRPLAMSTPAAPANGEPPAVDTIQSKDKSRTERGGVLVRSPVLPYITKAWYAARLYGIQYGIRSLLYLQSYWDWLAPSPCTPNLVKRYDVRPQFPVR
jgi:hypothetical protein